jgi:transposase
MTKRRYRSTEIKKVDVAQLAEAVGERVVVGVDIAKQDMFCAVMDGEAQVHRTVRWKHPQQSQAWQQMVEALGSDGRHVQVVMEPSGVYGDALRWSLEQAEVPVFRVNPKRSHDAAEVYDGVPSLHDAKSAAIVGKLHLDGASEPWPMRTERERSLTAAVRLLEVYEKQFQKNRNRLEAQVSRHWPELSRVLDLGSATLLELLAQFGGPAEVADSVPAARTLMRRIGGQFLDPDKVERVLASASRTAGVPQVEEENLLVRELAAEARRNQKASKRQQKRVEELTQAHEASASMRPVVGPTTAGVLVAAVGDPCHYGSTGAYEKALGLNLKEKSSGKQKGPLHITKRGPGVARLFLYLAALRMIQRDPICRAWYAKKVQRQGGRLKSKAVVALMRKLAKALWHVARGAEFDAALLFDTTRLQIADEATA